MTNLRKLAEGEPCIERWRPVVGWEGLYEVSNWGQVRSVSRWVTCRDGRRLCEGMILRQKLVFDRYFEVNLCDGERTCYIKVHRLVALAFVAGGGPHVRHLDGNGLNNNCENLAWGSAQQNEEDKRRHGRVVCGERHHNAKLTEKRVREIRELYGRGFSQLAIARELGINRGVVGKVVRNESWVHVS